MFTTTRCIRVFVSLVICLVASPGLQAAQSYYVNDAFTNGDLHCTAPGHNANDGLTPFSPKADVQAIMDSYDVQEDDTIWVDTGNYTLCDTFTVTLNGNALTASTPPTNMWLRALTFNDGGTAGATQLLLWAVGNAAPLSTVSLDYSADAGSTWAAIASNIMASSGLYIWDTTSFTDSTQALWRVTLEQDANVSDVNDLVFIVSNGTVQTPLVADHYVSASGSVPVYPYTNWATAASTIQDAVDAAVSGEVVLVNDGVYATGSRQAQGQELFNRVVITNDITVQSLNGPDHTFILGASSSNRERCVYISAGSLIGFTLTNGYASSGGSEADYRGGGVYAPGGTLSNCVVSGNYANGNGGGVYGGILNNCVISGNGANGGGGVYGGTLNNCVISGNNGSYGGGAYGGMLNNCVISENSAYLGGGVLCCSAYHCEIRNNTSGGGNGGGAYDSYLYRCSVISNICAFPGNGGGANGCTMISCLIQGNYAQKGGGAYGCNITSCTIVGNTAVEVGGIDGSAGTVRNSIIYNNRGLRCTNNWCADNLEYSCTTPLPSGPGNIANDPMFSADGWHISPESPCVEAGGVDYASGMDLDGQRWAYPPSMGCDEPAHTFTNTIFALSAYSGPYAGGNTITITTSNTFGMITNVLVAGAQATIQAFGTNSIAITLPATGSAGTKDIVIQTSDNGNITLARAYTVNPPGHIARYAGLPPLITLTDSWFDGTNGIILAGATAEDYSGRSVSSAGDVNGDGFADLLVSATSADPFGRSRAGETYLVYGRSNGLPPFVTLNSAWLNGANGIILTGATAEDASGYSVSSAGDVNGDGFADTLIGALSADPSGRSAAGETYLVYGRSNGLPPLVTLNNSWLDGTNGIILAGANPYIYNGRSVSSAGDVNGDGFMDLLIGADSASPSGLTGAGETYLVYGRANGLPPLVTLNNSWLDGTNGCILAGTAKWMYSGDTVSSAGDVNGDGFADFLIGASSTYAGATYLVYGRRNGLPAYIKLTGTWFDGRNGVILVGGSAGDDSGCSVSSAGDVNGDGFADLLIGAISADPFGRANAGMTYLVYGRSNGLPALITLNNSWLGGTNGIILAGAQANDSSGRSVSSAGDVNGDGFADLLVGVSSADPSGRANAGMTYLVYGSGSGLPALIMLSSTWFDGTNGVLLAGAKEGDFSGCSVSSAGDVNGDGLADLLVGAHGADPEGRSQAGETYLVYGKRTPVSVEPSCGSVTGGCQVIIYGRYLGDGSDITNVTLCGVSVANIVSQSREQVVVIAASGPIGLGEVRVFSTSYGETVASNAFTYTRDDQTGLNFYINDAFTSGDMYCTAAGDDANSGQSPGSPKESLQAILDNHDIEPGDTIWVDTGDYKLSRTITISALDAGAAGDPVVIQGSTNEVAGGSVFRFATSTSEVTVLQGITNRGFEMGYPGLVVPYEPGTNGWKSYSASGAGGMWDRSSTFSNELSMKLTVDESGWSYALISQDVNIRNTNHVSGSVSYEGWFRGDLSRADNYGEYAGAFLKMEFLDASLQHIGSPVENEWSNGRPLYGMDTSGLWVRVSITATNIPQATAFVRFAVGLNNFNSQLAATGWWDNVAAVIELDGGTVTCPTGAVVHIDGSSWITLSDLAVKDGTEGFKLTGSDGIRLTSCEARHNGCGILATESVVRMDNTRISGDGAGLKVESGSVVMDGCSLWGNLSTRLWATGGSLTLSNSIVWVSYWSGVGIRLEGSATYSGDYNDLVASGEAMLANIGGSNIATLVHWREATGNDQHSLSIDPQFANAGAGDFHLKSRAGSWSVPLQAWVTNDVDSPCIDTADPSAPYSFEPAPNGGNRNMGAYGNTPQASRSTDTDGDGLSDSYEIHVLHSDPDHSDSDGDGMSDGDELVAGMSCLDADSLFTCDMEYNLQEVASGTLVLSWPSSSGCVYNVEHATNLLSGFIPLAINIPATYPVNTYRVDLRVVQGRYYRVTCQKPPP